MTLTTEVTEWVGHEVHPAGGSACDVSSYSDTLDADTVLSVTFEET